MFVASTPGSFFADNTKDANVRFFSAHTAQVKISRDWWESTAERHIADDRDSLPEQLRPALLNLLLDILADSISPTQPHSFQPGNAVVVRKLFGCVSSSLCELTDQQLASMLLRLPFHQFPNPIQTVLNVIGQALARATNLPPSVPASGYATPTNFPSQSRTLEDEARLRSRMRLWALEWCGICVEEIGRAGISEQKR